MSRKLNYSLLPSHVVHYVGFSVEGISVLVVCVGIRDYVGPALNALLPLKYSGHFVCSEL